MNVLVLRADARALPLPAASVDLIVTSPPYWSLRSYTDDGAHYAGQIGAEPTPAAYLANLIDCTREWIRVLKPAGSMWVNLGDKYATTGGTGGHTGANGTGQRARRRTGTTTGGPPPKSLLGLPWRYANGCVDQLGLILRAELIWSKINGLPESVTDRVRRSHEQWFHLVKQPRYFASLDTVREPLTSASLAHDARRRSRTDARLTAANAGMVSTANERGKLPGSVWPVASQPLRIPAELGVEHFAAFPMVWPRRLITGWSPDRATVLDPFGGTGTTALVASVLGRRAITVDASGDYCRVARWRTTDPAQRARATRP